MQSFSLGSTFESAIFFLFNFFFRFNFLIFLFFLSGVNCAQGAVCACLGVVQRYVNCQHKVFVKSWLYIAWVFPVCLCWENIHRLCPILSVWWSCRYAFLRFVFWGGFFLYFLWIDLWSGCLLFLKSISYWFLSSVESNRWEWHNVL